MTGRAACVDVLPHAQPERAEESSSATAGRAQPAATRPDHRRAWLPYLVVIALLAVASASVPAERGRWLVPVGGVVALAALLRAAGGRRGADRRLPSSPFVLLSAGLVLTVVSEVLGAAGGSAHGRMEPVALSAYPFLVAGLVALNRTRVREHAVDTLLVAAIGPSAVVAFGWLPLVEAVERWAGTSADSSWASWLVLSVDALAVAIVMRLAVLFRGRPVAYQMLLGAMACMLGAHIARAIGSAIGLAPAPLGSQALLLISFALVAGASLHPSMTPPTTMRTRADSIGRGHVLLLVAVVLAGPVFALVRYGDRGSWVLLVAGGPAAVSLLVVAHLARLIRERQRLEHLSTHDGLTGLPNRTAFHDRLALLLSRAGDTDGPAVVFLDLDRFKHVNDTFGHDVGDDLLRQVAARLRQGVRADDTVARLAGDEFALLLTAPCGAERADDVVRRVLDSFSEPFLLPGVALSVSPSMGVALSPEHGTDVEVLLRNADSAMYAAKAGGRNGARTFQPGMASATERHLLLERRFRRCLAEGELAVHYQPRVDPATRRLVGVEALVRWDHPRLGLVPPGAFIPMAESTGLVADLGRQVLERACADAASWRRAGASLAVSVNVSPRQFALQDVPAVVAGALARSGLPADALELEITESLHLGDDGSVNEALERIHQLGVTCAVDDFGTGYSSIAVLRDYPIGVVKLDRSFVQPVGGDDDAPLVRGVVQLAQGLGLRVVAEGVETEAQMDFLAGILCDEIQGFLISRAVPAAQIACVVEHGGDPTALPGVVPVLLDVDERGLVELLWAEQEELERAQTEPHEMRLAAVLGTAATVMAVPIALGLGAGGGLPPVLQGSMNATLLSIGLQGPVAVAGLETGAAVAALEPGAAVAAPVDVAARPEPPARERLLQIPAQRTGGSASRTVQRGAARPAAPATPASTTTLPLPEHAAPEPPLHDDAGPDGPADGRAVAPSRGGGAPARDGSGSAPPPPSVPAAPAPGPGQDSGGASGAGTPGGAPAGRPAGKPAGKPVGTPGKPVGAPGKPVGTPGKPVGTPGKPVGTPGKPVGTPVGTPGGKPVGTPGGGAAEESTPPGPSTGAPVEPGSGKPDRVPGRPWPVSPPDRERPVRPPSGAAPSAAPEAPSAPVAAPADSAAPEAGSATDVTAAPATGSPAPSPEPAAG